MSSRRPFRGPGDPVGAARRGEVAPARKGLAGAGAGWAGGAGRSADRRAHLPYGRLQKSKARGVPADRAYPIPATASPGREPRRPAGRPLPLKRNRRIPPLPQGPAGPSGAQAARPHTPAAIFLFPFPVLPGRSPSMCSASSRTASMSAALMLSSHPGHPWIFCTVKPLAAPPPPGGDFRLDFLLPRTAIRRGLRRQNAARQALHEGDAPRPLGLDALFPRLPERGRPGARPGRIPARRPCLPAEKVIQSK